jgi:hypothetical protein
VLATRSAVELGLSLGIWRIILEGDSIQVVHALHASNGGGFSYGSIIEDTQQLCRRFLEYTLRYVQREANGEAHRLAKLALSSRGEHGMANYFHFKKKKKKYIFFFVL